jgi:hypothetical protein
MSYLCIAEDEREFTHFLCGELGAQLLLADVAPGGEPRVAKDPFSALPPDLPERAKFGTKQVHTLIFWLPHCGPIKTMRDAPEPKDARERVSRLLTQEAASEQFADVIDLERTPVLRLIRSHRHAPNRLAPGNLGSMAVRSSTIPEEVKRKHSKALRWLKKRGVKTDPFAHCPEVKDQRPEKLGPLWVWVQPHAMKLVERGTEIWPWNA